MSVAQSSSTNVHRFISATVASFERCHLIQPARCMPGEPCFACDVTTAGSVENYAESREIYSTVNRKYEVKALISCHRVEIVRCKSRRRQERRVYP